MSDPVQDHEIEDVLSSIRRLVSAEPVRPEARAADRLILTSEQRIAPPASPARDPGDPDYSEAADSFPARPDETPAPRQAARPLTLEQRIAELEIAINAQAQDFEPDGSEDTLQHRPSRMPGLSLAPQTSDPEETADIAAALSGDELRFTSRRGAVAASRDAASEEPAPEPEAQGQNDDLATALSELIADTDPLERPAPLTLGAAEAVTAEDDDARAVEEAEDDGDESSGLDAAVAAEIEAAVTESATDRTADALRLSDAADSPPIGAETEAQPDNLLTFHGPPRAPGREEAASGEGELMDEAALRELVAEIVREELQGALGEKITRNVRKLVRREIMRAIAIRDFE
ncbi:hypothetical protein SAMN04490244_11462 [Tranquillimonas rosea]|uniref:Uncharacterized protein n=1 Tax=Tranquillimonas rosea TaxID=641238 RepID=A0A1H9WXX4_9RHOB|nr:hypothetical protein [Tranquillimonas rosea]SES38750.1 hypothetical protein SAMN04490244_11462 [Tranquillimonas rosea]